MSRREKIEALLADDPSDQFLRYSLAMELDKEGQHERSLAEFGGLMSDAAPYVPAYFMAAQQLARLQRVAEARAALRSGIEQARAAGDSHAAGEMSEFLASLGALGE
jgi:thioredoxin-like negative regulator of GroEL